MKVYSMSRHGTDFEVYTVKDGQFEFIIDDGTDSNYGVVTLDTKQIEDLIDKLDHQIFVYSVKSPENSSRCGCTVNDGCGEWQEKTALEVYDERNK